VAQIVLTRTPMKKTARLQLRRSNVRVLSTHQQRAVAGGGITITTVTTAYPTSTIGATTIVIIASPTGTCHAVTWFC
jgi:hypothetical protein